MDMHRAPGQAHPNRKLTEAEWDELFRQVYGEAGQRTTSVEAICAERGISKARFYKKRAQRLAS